MVSVLSKPEETREAEGPTPQASAEHGGGRGSPARQGASVPLPPAVRSIQAHLHRGAGTCFTPSSRPMLLSCGDSPHPTPQAPRHIRDNVAKSPGISRPGQRGSNRTGGRHGVEQTHAQKGCREPVLGASIRLVTSADAVIVSCWVVPVACGVCRALHSEFGDVLSLPVRPLSPGVPCSSGSRGPPGLGTCSWSWFALRQGPERLVCAEAARAGYRVCSRLMEREDQSDHKHTKRPH